MSKQYYICEIIGDGSDFNPYRPAVADSNVSWTASIPSDPTTGVPLYENCLAIVGTSNHGVLNNNSKIDALPDFPMIGKLSAMQGKAKADMDTMLTKRGFSTANVQASDGYKDLLQAIGKQRDTAFDISIFDVIE
jgi:hypothetical protein